MWFFSLKDLHLLLIFFPGIIFLVFLNFYILKIFFFWLRLKDLYRKFQDFLSVDIWIGMHLSVFIQLYLLNFSCLTKVFLSGIVSQFPKTSSTRSSVWASHHKTRLPSSFTPWYISQLHLTAASTFTPATSCVGLSEIVTRESTFLTSHFVPNTLNNWMLLLLKGWGMWCLVTEFSVLY